ncbi:MAG: S8 family peptidase [Butyrivibrio sp.]|nr:S8 family peptidase [Butyrivibrio sp.]
MKKINNILQLKGRFEKRKNDAGFGQAKLPANQNVTSLHLNELAEQLRRIKEYWSKNRDIEGAIVSVHYIRVVAKSNRLRILLSEKGKSPAESIRGAKFATETTANGSEIHKHIFTHYVQIDAIDRAINNLVLASKIIQEDYSGKITAEHTEKLGKEYPYTRQDMKKTNFLYTVLDAFFVEYFDIDMNDEPVTEESIITIYKTNVETKKLLAKFGINILETRIIDGTTILLSPDEAQLLYSKAPYLIAMSVRDFSQIRLEDISDEKIEKDSGIIIPKPTNEPTIGVIDTHFDENVYFHEWVEYRNMLPPEIDLEVEDFYHGTAVTSIIVDGPKGNPRLDDGCGRFKVRHFGVSRQSGFSSFAVLRNIKDIVAGNRDIKVWNLSLGSPEPIKDNFISPEAAELDRIQSEYDVIFVVAGTNTPDGKQHSDMKVGSPADSLNSIVVNSVDFEEKPASYARRGPVLSFFHKPDISYYGGDGTRQDEQIAVCVNDLGAVYRVGTSFAASWISRKLAYLIHVMGLSREIAKALIIDSAAAWRSNGAVSDTLGYGVVPRRIEDILNTKDDEIKFVIMGTAEDYETYTYNLPVPVVNGRHPFYARAVLIYFPPCDRNQGVDYTSTEMDIHFGRVKTVREKSTIYSIDDNKQTEEGQIIYEEEARSIYRKWDNVKRLCEEIKERAVPRKSYDAGMWGLGIYTKDRTTPKNREALQFGVVITLKEMYGKNRIDDFIKMCMAKGWIVNRLDVENRLDVYAKAEEDVEWE